MGVWRKTLGLRQTASCFYLIGNAGGGAGLVRKKKAVQFGTCRVPDYLSNIQVELSNGEASELSPGAQETELKQDKKS